MKLKRKKKILKNQINELNDLSSNLNDDSLTKLEKEDSLKVKVDDNSIAGNRLKVESVEEEAKSKNDKNENNENGNNNLPKRIPKRISQHHKHIHKQRKHRFNKLSSIFVYSLPSPLENNQLLDALDDQNLVNNRNEVRNQNKNERKNEIYYSNIQSLTNSLIKLHRKARRRKAIYNNQFSLLYKKEAKRKARRERQSNFDDKEFHKKTSSKKRYFNQFLNQTKPAILNSLSKFTLFLTPTLSTLTAENQSTEWTRIQLNASSYPQSNAINLHLNKHCSERIGYFKNLNTPSPLQSSNETIEYFNLDNNQKLNALNQIKDFNSHNNSVPDYGKALEYAKNLMVLIYIVILVSVFVLLLRVFYIAILRKLRRPIHGQTSQSQNSTRHSSQLYTQNQFNQAHLSYQPSGANNSNSNVNISTYGGRSDPNSIVSGGTASFIGNLTGTLIEHNVQLNRTSQQDKIKKEKSMVDETNRNPIKIDLPTDSPISGSRPISRQSGKFCQTDNLNIISDEFSSSVYDHT